MSKKEIHYQGLAELSVIVEDTSALSPDYFKVTKLPTELTAGLNTFKFKGQPQLFPEGAAIYIEILDANGEPIYYEVNLDLESEEQPAIVSIYVTQDTTPGNGTIIICAGANQTAEGDILDPSEINIRWQVPIYIDISKRNEDAIIFSELPIVTLSSSIGSHKELTYYDFNSTYPTANKSQTQTDSFTTVTNRINYYYNNDTPVITLPADIDVNSYGFGAPINGFLSHIENATISFTYNRIASSTPTRPSNIVQSTVSASVSSFSGSLIAYLSEPLSYALSNSNDRFYPKSLNLNRMDITYVMPTEPDAFGYVFSKTTENTYNIVTASFVNLQTLTGEIAKIRTYYKSSGINEYLILNETDITTYAEEFGFNTSSLQTTFSLPTSHRNEKIDFKFEFVNPAGNASKQVIEVKDNTLTGGNTYIGGDDNLMTGSLYVAGSTGNGVHISGKGSAAMIRSIGYNGFFRATNAGPGGFVIYSGSVQPLLDASESYSGVGIELVANSSSYFRYTTAGNGSLDIRTDTFFLGNQSGSYISGSNGTLSISSSNFIISPEGDVSVTGDINATTGIFQNVIITGYIPPSYISGSTVINKTLLEPWFTGSTVIDNTYNAPRLFTDNPVATTTMSFGLSRWREGSGTDFVTGRTLFAEADPKAALYDGGASSFDDLTWQTTGSRPEFDKWGSITSYQNTAYADKISYGTYKSTIDTIVFAVGSDASVFDITSDLFTIDETILSNSNNLYRPLNLQFAAKFGNYGGFTDYSADYGGILRFYLRILDENDNIIFTQLKTQNSFFEWLNFNVSLTNILTTINANGSKNIRNKFKIKLEWQQRDATMGAGDSVDHIRITELRIVQLAESEGFKTRGIYLDSSALISDQSGSMHFGNLYPAADGVYDLGAFNTTRPPDYRFRWRKIYCNVVDTDVINSNSITNTYGINTNSVYSNSITNANSINNGNDNKIITSNALLLNGRFLSGSSYQTVVGRYNRYNTFQDSFIIGNGASSGSRSNLLFASGSTVQITGSLNIAGSINATGSATIRESLITGQNPDPGETGGYFNVGNYPIGSISYSTLSFYSISDTDGDGFGKAIIYANAEEGVTLQASSYDNTSPSYLTVTEGDLYTYNSTTRLNAASSFKVVSPNVQITGSLNIKDILQLSVRTTTPTPSEGMIIASGSAGSSKLYYYDGTIWNALF
jgi:hypothetical protein